MFKVLFELIRMYLSFIFFNMKKITAKDNLIKEKVEEVISRNIYRNSVD